MYKKLLIDNKTIDIFPAETPNAPLVLLNSYMRSNGSILKKSKEIGCNDFTLVEISGLNWDNDLSPWTAPPIGKDDETFGGKADSYLELLLSKIIPAAKGELTTKPKAVLLAGYSLAGLFALYAAVNSNLFQAVASCSGSLWYPGFSKYIKEQDPAVFPKYIYFSLGDREARTKNEILRTVEENTREISAYLSEHGINTIFELNKGNHFQQGELRTAKGIKWILEAIP